MISRYFYCGPHRFQNSVPTMYWRKLFKQLGSTFILKKQDGTALTQTNGRCAYFISRNSSTTTTTPSSGNIYLMGSPGAGKTTSARNLSKVLGLPCLDIDDDHLEKCWKKTVAEKLEEVGHKEFVMAEGEASLKLVTSSSIISLSGSNPMYPKAMDYLKKSGVVVYLDVQHSDIAERLDKMKVDRIVGQKSGVPITDVLKFREQFYEENYDIRIICEPSESEESIGQKIKDALHLYKHPTHYTSTRGKTLDRLQKNLEQMEEDLIESRIGINPRNLERATKELKTNPYKKEMQFSDVVLQGLARDGGLNVPDFEKIPSFTIGQWERLLPLSYADRALRILEQWIHPTHLHPAKLKEMIDKAYCIDNFNCHKICPVNQISSKQFVLELFHGPTASFKDLALQLMPQFFNYASTRDDIYKRKYLILVATSGDTGGAVLDGFSKYADDTLVMVLFPEDGISSVQKAQMTSAQGKNVHVVGVKSDFDFCQTSIKEIFQDPDTVRKLSEKYGLELSAANSINWGRLLPQIVYHASGYLDMVVQGNIVLGQPIDICVPTGNFGDMLGAYYAKQMGIPFRKLICASNTNNVLCDFFNTGVYDISNRKVHSTASPAIDILKSSNLERYLYHVMGNDHKEVSECFGQLADHGKFQVSDKVLSKIKGEVSAGWCSAAECLSCIKETFKKTGYLMDPHTAVAKHVADQYQSKHYPILIASTAHYGKFAPEVLAALGSPLGSNIQSGLADTPLNFTPIWKIENYNADKMLGDLEALRPTPKMHQALAKSAKKMRIHKNVIEPDVKSILNELMKFAESREMRF